MSDATLRIKNLSTALEALSNIADLEGDLDTIQQGVKELLQEEIHTFKEEKEKETQWPNRPARTTTNNIDDN